MHNDTDLLITKLDAFIRKFYKDRLIRGVLYSVGLLVAFFLVAALLEYAGRFGTGARTALFWGTLVAAAVVIVATCAPSTNPSSTAVTVTVCATFQLALVKVSVPVEIVVCASGVSPMLTSALGCEVNTTVKLPVAPPSVAAMVVGLRLMSPRLVSM